MFRTLKKNLPKSFASLIKVRCISNLLLSFKLSAFSFFRLIHNRLAFPPVSSCSLIVHQFSRSTQLITVHLINRLCNQIFLTLFINPFFVLTSTYSYLTLDPITITIPPLLLQAPHLTDGHLSTHHVFFFFFN